MTGPETSDLPKIEGKDLFSRFARGMRETFGLNSKPKDGSGIVQAPDPKPTATKLP